MERAIAVARLRALRTALLALHKVLLDTERRRYERANGRIASPQAALRLVLSDPWFRWLDPLLRMIVRVDERLADEKPLDSGEVGVFVDDVRTLLQREDGDPRFRTEYHRSLQETPDVVLAHGRVVKLTAGRSV